jgi:RNA polymerase sigma factor (sigma-70 family)
MGPVTDIGFEAAYASLHRLALTRARRVLGNDADAEEIAQEVMLRAYSSWSSVSSYGEAWVTRVANNLAISAVRRSGREPGAPSQARTTGHESERVDVTRALSSLPTRQREVLVLRHIADVSEEEVAKMLDISVGSVKRHLHRATQTLKDMPSMAAAYKRDYEFMQKGLRLLQEHEELMQYAPEPCDGWPPPPWDACELVEEDGGAVWLAVDADGRPILDADGDEVFSSVATGFLLCKRIPGPRPKRPETVLPLDALDADALAAVERAREVAERLGQSGTSGSHLGVALAERMDDPAPLELDALLRGLALRSDGPHADARLALYAKRDAAGWMRPRRDGVLPTGVTGLVKPLRYAAIQASRRRGLVTCEDLLDALLQPRDLPPPPPPPQVISIMQDGIDDRVPEPVGWDIPIPAWAEAPYRRILERLEAARAATPASAGRRVTA